MELTTPAGYVVTVLTDADANPYRIRYGDIDVALTRYGTHVGVVGTRQVCGRTVESEVAVEPQGGAEMPDLLLLAVDQTIGMLAAVGENLDTSELDAVAARGTAVLQAMARPAVGRH